MKWTELWAELKEWADANPEWVYRIASFVLGFLFGAILL